MYMYTYSNVFLAILLDELLLLGKVCGARPTSMLLVSPVT